MLNKIAVIFFIVWLFSGYNAIAAEKDNSHPIDIKLNTEQEIAEALKAVQNADKPFYDKLMSLKQNDEKEFKSRLYNRYFTILQKEKLLAMKKPRVKGYRELVKDSEILFSELRNRLKNAKDEADRANIKAEIAKASDNRFQIELDFLKYRANKAKAYSDVLQNKVSDFETKRTKYIERVTNRNS